MGDGGSPGVAGHAPLSWRKQVNTTKRVLNFIRERVDVEMFQKGWWMLLLILGTIGALKMRQCVKIRNPCLAYLALGYKMLD